MFGDAVLRRHLANAPVIGGYTPTAVGPNEMGHMIHTGFHHSGEDAFHRLAPQFWSIYCQDPKANLRPEFVSDFLAVIHGDNTAEVFAGNIQRVIRYRAKRHIAPFAKIPMSDLADVIEQRFDDIEIRATDSIVYCFRVGWRYGLYFDFGPSLGMPRAREEDLWKALGNAQRLLLFFEEYTAHERSSTTGLLTDGWFPFIHILGGEYSLLANYYGDPGSKRFVGDFVKKFDSERLSKMTDAWWSNPIYGSKKEVLLAGIDAFSLGTDRGAIACLKTLYSEIEGIIRLSCCREKNVGNPKFSELLSYINEKASEKFDSTSLAFPGPFYTYLRDQVFANFDVLSGNIPISRHSSSHGVAEAETYTRARALQAILTLDQLNFYLANGDKKDGEDSIKPAPEATNT